ncbi:hypothetical protein ACWFRM_40500, partial [Streptomyces sp. NPDC055144]
AKTEAGRAVERRAPAPCAGLDEVGKVLSRKYRDALQTVRACSTGVQGHPVVGSRCRSGAIPNVHERISGKLSEANPASCIIGRMPATYHEAFWGALIGLASAVVLAQVIISAISNRASRRVRARESAAVAASAPVPINLRMNTFMIVASFSYMIQLLVLLAGFASLAHATDEMPPMAAAVVELVLLASLPFATRLSEEIIQELDVPESDT